MIIRVEIDLNITGTPISLSSRGKVSVDRCQIIQHHFLKSGILLKRAIWLNTGL